MPDFFFSQLSPSPQPDRDLSNPKPVESRPSFADIEAHLPPGSVIVRPPLECVVSAVKNAQGSSVAVNLHVFCPQKNLNVLAFPGSQIDSIERLEMYCRRGFDHRLAQLNDAALAVDTQSQTLEHGRRVSARLGRLEWTSNTK